MMKAEDESDDSSFCSAFLVTHLLDSLHESFTVSDMYLNTEKQLQAPV